MTKHSLRPIAVCVMLANALPLFAQQPVSLAGRIAPKAGLAAAQLGTVNQAAAGAIEGKAQDATGQALPDAKVRLRNARTGKVIDTKVADDTGAFAFKNVDAGDYLVELIDSNDKVLAASRMITLTAGDSVATVVALPAASAAGFLATNAGVAAIIIGSAAAAGVLATQSNDATPNAAPATQTNNSVSPER